MPSAVDNSLAVNSLTASLIPVAVRAHAADRKTLS